MQEIIDAAVGHLSLENVERGQFARLFDAQAALHEQFQQCPIPERVHLIGPRIAARGCDLRRFYSSFPLLKSEGANLRHLALQIKYRGCDTSSGAFPCLVETVPEKCVARRWNRSRSETLEGRVGFGCPSAEVREENAQVHQPAMCSWAHFVAGTRTSLYLASAPDRMRDVVANMARQNLGAPLNVGVLIPNESPKMCEGNDFMSQCPIDITDAGLVGVQIQGHDLPETIWHTSVLDQFRRCHPLSPAVAGRTSLRGSRKHAE